MFISSVAIGIGRAVNFGFKIPTDFFKLLLFDDPPSFILSPLLQHRELILRFQWMNYHLQLT